MSNSLLTIDQITRKSLEILENNLVITRNINRQYDDSFAKTGAKIGSTLRIRLPDRALVKDGAALGVEDDNEQFTTLSITSQKHIGINFTTAEMALSLDDFAERVLKPRISQLAATVDADVANVYRQLAYSVGTPGTVPATSRVMLDAQQKLNEAAAPMSPRYLTVNPAANAGLVEGMKGLFAPVSVIDRQFRSGAISDNILGFNEVNMSQSIKMHLTGTRTNGTVTTTVAAQGQATIDLSGLGANATIRAGDVFTIANVFQVNPQTRESTGALQQFVVTADVTASGGGAATNVPIWPAIYTSSEALATVNSFPQATAAVVFYGAANTQYPQNLFYHRDAIAMATADLLLPQGVDMASRQVYNGISMRIVRQYDINNDRMPCRVDVLYGYAAIRRELGGRMWG